MKMHDWEFTHGEETAIAFFTPAMADGIVELGHIRHSFVNYSGCSIVYRTLHLCVQLKQ